MNKAAQISQNTIEVIIIIGIVIVLNILGQYFYARYDLTEGKIYTLAQSSKEVVSELPDLVHLRVYVNDDLPPTLQPADQTLRDLLEEYRASASTRLVIQYINPGDLDEGQIGSLSMKGIQSTQVQITQEDELSIQEVWMGLEISYLDSYEVIPFVPTVRNLEYEITSSILKLISEYTPTIGFLTGHGEMATEGSQYMPAAYSALAEILKELYIVIDVDLGTGRHIADKIDTLVIAQPTELFTERHRYVIDQFVMRGGKLVVLGIGHEIDQMSSDEVIFKAFPLDSLLAEYGIRINNDVVVDLQFNHQIPMQMGPLQVYRPYPLIPIITIPNGFPSDNPATRGLSQLYMPFVSSITLLYDKIPDDMEISELAKTSAKSYSRTVPVVLDPNQNFTPPGGLDDLKHQLVAVQLSGTFTSVFEGEAIPAFDPEPEAEEGAIPEMDDQEMLTSGLPTSITVIGNPAMLDDNWIKAPGNSVFIQNLMESLNIGEALIDIRTRTLQNRPLDPELTPADKNGLRFWGYFFVPILITILGTARFYLKGQRKKLMQAIQTAEKDSGK